MMISECCTKEKPLLRRAQSGDPDAIELFLAGYVPLLRALAKRFFAFLCPCRICVRPVISG